MDRKLIAVRDIPSVRPRGEYKTRMLKAGEEFSLSRQDAAVLVAQKKAEYAKRAQVELPPPPLDVAKALAEPAPAEATHDHDERDRLRALAEAMGIEIDGRWGVARLQEAIEAAHPAPADEAKDG